MPKTSSGSHSKRFPYWLRQSVRFDEAVRETKNLLCDLQVNTVCQDACCPNIYDCFSRKKCTFLILGDRCTRNCGFCAIKTQKRDLRLPQRQELFRIRDAVKRLGMHNIVITSVTRDDLNDGGSANFADCISILRGLDMPLRIEVLVPDFLGKKSSIERVVLAGPDVFSHNVETVPRLYSKVRPEADYRRSLEVVRLAKEIDPSLITKSGLMVGLGEQRSEVYSVMKDLKKTGCDIITIGQYLRPDHGSLEVEEFLRPEEFECFSGWARQLHFKGWSSSPFTRSSLESEEVAWQN